MPVLRVIQQSWSGLKQDSNKPSRCSGKPKKMFPYFADTLLNGQQNSLINESLPVQNINNLEEGNNTNKGATLEVQGLIGFITLLRD